MNESNFKRVIILIIMLLCATVYVESHVKNDYDMVEQIRVQQRQIIMMKSYIRILESGKSGKWKRCI